MGCSLSLDLASLRLLVEIRERGSLSKAAKAVGISQPAATKRITQLERSLGLPLAIRVPTGSRLTRQGHIIAESSGCILEGVDQLLSTVATLRDEAKSVLHVAASLTIAEHLMPAWLFQLRLADGGLHAGLRVANSEQVQGLVLQGKADIGFVEGPRIDARLAHTPVAADRLVVVVAPGHAWARSRRPISACSLLRTPLVVRESGSGTRLTLDEVLQGTAVEPLLELGSNEAVKGAVAAGAGPAVLSMLAVGPELASGRLVEVSVHDMDLKRSLNAVWPAGQRLTPPSNLLLRIATRS